MNKSYINLAISFIVYMLLQVVLLRNIALFDTSFCFVYVVIVLLLPLETDRILLMLIGFISGLLIDVFYNSLGIHAASLVIISYLRYHWINTLTPQGGYVSNISPNLTTMGGQWFSTYTLPLIFIHHFTLFFVESGGFSLFGFTLLKVILSTFFTFFVIIIAQVLFSKTKRTL